MGLHGAELLLVWVLWVVVLKQMELLGRRFTLSQLFFILSELSVFLSVKWASSLGSTGDPL